ncbi:platelet-derived growth factor D-like [Oncorhynchus masou masou]|uniref:platelet-derived growth factor D-like n=1 Tax=Oncorhynchus masou masou TaxID=90313 RepID=UPI003183DD59
MCEDGMGVSVVEGKMCEDGTGGEQTGGDTSQHWEGVSVTGPDTSQDWDGVDLDRLYDDVKHYSCTPRNYSVNLREELRATNAVFFPRCLLVQRCGGNCACGTDNWNGCTCSPAKTSDKLHEVLKYAPEVGGFSRRRTARVRWVLEEVHLTHHERCDCVCPSRPPR